MQRECRNGHPLSVAGRLVVRWCSECCRFEILVWASSSEYEATATLIPEWASVVRLEDDEWRDRSLTKYVTALASTVRLLQADDDSGVRRLL